MASENETIDEILSQMIDEEVPYDDLIVWREDGSADLSPLHDRLKAAWKRQEQCYLDQIRDAVNMAGHEQYLREHKPVDKPDKLGNAAAMCGDNRFEIIEAAKKKLLDSTNIERSAVEMSVLDDLLFRMWQMGWLPDCKPVGNAAALREACAKMRQLLMLRGDGKVRCILSWDEFNESQKMLRAALAAPPRNVDKYASHVDALNVWRETPPNESGCFDEWLYATEKGGAE